MVAIVLATAAGSAVKSVTGLGQPLFAVPLLAPVIGVETAVVVISLPNLLANVLLVKQVHRSRSDTRDLPVLLTTSVAGTVLGTAALVSWPEEPLFIVLVGLIAVFVWSALRSNNLAIPEAAGRRWSPLVGLVAGLAQGAVGVSGPVVVTWLYAYRLSRDAFILSITSIFLVTSVAQIGALAAAGAYTTGRLVAAAVAFIPVAVIIPTGERLRRHLSSTAFDRSVLAVLLVAACVLTARVVT